MPRIQVEDTHPDRVMFPADGITKRDLVDYYCEVADTMLPHLKSRPLNVQRFPRGIGEKGFLHQDFADALPTWISHVEVAKESGNVVHPVAERREALGWLANQNCITLHIWQSRQARLPCPDRLVFDLDPSVSDFAVVRATARATAGVLDDLGLACYVQTTGSRGLHVVVPLRGDTDFDTTRQFARDVAEVIVADDPDHRTVESRKAKRDGRVYLDIMRNGYAQTAVAPYSVRARAGAPVATPLEWEELSTRGLRANRFTVRDIPKRIAGQPDPWAAMPRHSRSLTGPLQRLAKLCAWIAGLGNLLADEICWRARINPTRPVSDLAADDVKRLHTVMTEVLRTAVRHGRVPGLSRWLTGVRDDPDPHCPRCGTALSHDRINGRMSWWCPNCQPR